VLIYFYLPALRADSFPDEIWADRFIRGDVALSSRASNAELFVSRFDEFYAALVATRRRITGRTARDRIELVIANYASSNALWFNVCVDRFRFHFSLSLRSFFFFFLAFLSLFFIFLHVDMERKL
jgi:hypothetical protein